jgi:hypothetical protein
MVQGQLGRRDPDPAIMTETGRNPVAPPLGFAQVTGFLPLTTDLLFGDIAEKAHKDRIANPGWRIQRKLQ